MQKIKSNYLWTFSEIIDRNIICYRDFESFVKYDYNNNIFNSNNLPVPEYIFFEDGKELLTGLPLTKRIHDKIQEGLLIGEDSIVSDATAEELKNSLENISNAQLNNLKRALIKFNNNGNRNIQQYFDEKSTFSNNKKAQ